MIVWINGAFGVGKTSVARIVVVSRLPCRPRVDDFQDIPSWRRWTLWSVLFVSKLHRHVVVPMTLVDPNYFDEIVGELQRRRKEVRHFALLAEPTTLRARLAERGSAAAWGERQIDRCVEALATPRFATHISTDDLGLNAVAQAILDGISDTPNPSALRPEPLKRV